MPKSKSKGQFDHYKKWTTDEGYTFLAETKADALDYLSTMPNHVGEVESLREVKDV